MIHAAPGADADGMIVVGLMSGTSLDGVTAAAARFSTTREGKISFELLAHHTEPYNEQQRDSIRSVLEGGTPEALALLNFELGRIFAQTANGFIDATGIPRQSIAAISSHGQTVWHVPAVATLQIGEPAVIAEQTGLPVVSDFRTRDVAAGGHGAPLVPIADLLLFSDAKHWRVLQNIGGMANLTVVPPGGGKDGVLAFDTGPGVVIVDRFVELLTTGAARMDEDGRLSAAGSPITSAVAEFLDHPFFAEPPPRSTGRELFSPHFINMFLERCREHSPSAGDADLVATAVALTAESIAMSLRRFVTVPLGDVLLSGGGARHPRIVAELRRLLAPVPVRDFSDVYFDGEAKEAVAFALLGWLHLRGEYGNVPAATGARGERVLGKLTPP